MLTLLSYVSNLLSTDASADDSECHLTPTFQVLTEADCQTSYHIPLAECEGSCGSNADTCCRPASTELVNVTMTCSNGTSLTTQVTKNIMVAIDFTLRYIILHYYIISFVSIDKLGKLNKYVACAHTKKLKSFS